jgi:hypothetical protein
MVGQRIFSLVCACVCALCVKGAVSNYYSPGDNSFQYVCECRESIVLVACNHSRLHYEYILRKYVSVVCMSVCCLIEIYVCVCEFWRPFVCVTD